MSVQKKHISELGYVHSGGSPSTLKEVENRLSGLSVADISSAGDVPVFYGSLDDLLRQDLPEVAGMEYGCCLVPADVAGFPVALRETDTAAYVFTRRSSSGMAYGIQELVGADSGIRCSRRINSGILTAWNIGGGGSGDGYLTFSIDPATRELVMHTAPGYAGAGFALENGNLTITI